MMDIWLSFLPPFEPLLRVYALSVSAICAFSLTTLGLSLAFDWAGEQNPIKRIIFSGIVLLFSPELFYLGLVYSPYAVAMTFLLIAHLLAKRASRHWGIGLASIVLFGIGTACRWNAGLYLVVIFIDLLPIKQGFKQINTAPKTAIRALIWAVLALISALFWVLLSNGQSGIFDGVSQGEAFIQTTETAWFSIASTARVLSLLPLTLVLLLVYSIFVLVKQKRWWLLISLVLCTLCTLPFLREGKPKDFTILMPTIWACVILACNHLKEKIKPVFLYPVFFILLIAPWFLGVQMQSSTAWGPGFEVQYPHAAPNVDDAALVVSSMNAMHGVKSIAIRPAAGFYLDTPEGGRPLGGHAFVLFKAWRQFNRNRDAEIDYLVNFAMHDDNHTIVQYSSSLVLGKMMRYGYISRHPEWIIENDLYKSEIFSDDSGNEIRIIFIKDPALVFSPIFFNLIEEPEKNLPLYMSYPSKLAAIWQVCPQAFNFTGPFTAFFDPQITLTCGK